MLMFLQVKFDGEIEYDNPLHVGKFFNLENTWWRKRKQRQIAILSIALTWYKIVKQNPLACGFIQHEVMLTTLKSKLADSRKIIEHFFEISKLGFNFGNGDKSPTLITPKRLNKKIYKAIERIEKNLQFDPGEEPLGKDLVESTVKVRTERASYILQQLNLSGKTYLLPAVKWLLSREEPIKFYYERSGKLQARDKSVWPVKSIETWPGWLRTELFGRVVDIENAYCQFLVNNLEKKYEDNLDIIRLKYPDILRSVYDKTNFRNYICCDLLKLEINEENIKLVKKLIMSLANGSNVTPNLIMIDNKRSEAARIIREANPNLAPVEIIECGKKLSFIAKQFRSAKKDLCTSLLNEKPSSKNAKKIFQRYFEWERIQRYKIWETVGKNGLMLHDGIDGISHHLTDELLEKHIVDEIQVRVSVETPA